MLQKLRNMLVPVGVFILGAGGAGVGYFVYTPTPAARAMLELRDAGIVDGQRIVLVCPERLTGRTKSSINRIQPGVLRPRQSYARVARLAFCFSPDGGNCFNAATGAPRMADLQGEVIIPSLRKDVVDTVDGDDGGEDEVDDALQYRNDDCKVLMCPQLDALIDAGTFVNPYANGFCGAVNRLAVQPLPNMIPDCRQSDGGWDIDMGEPGHEGAPNCKFSGPFGLADGGPRWAGCNSYPAQYASGNQCLPVESSVVSGDSLTEEWP